MPNVWNLGRARILPIAGVILSILFSLCLAASFPNIVKVENNLWFGADVKRVILYMTDPSFSHNRTSTHPLFPLLMLPLGWPIAASAMLVGFEQRFAQGISAQLITSLSAGVTWLLIYLISVNLGLSRFSSFVLGLFFCLPQPLCFGGLFLNLLP